MSKYVEDTNTGFNSTGESAPIDGADLKLSTEVALTIFSPGGSTLI